MKNYSILIAVLFCAILNSCTTTDSLLHLRGFNIQGYNGKAAIYEDDLKRDCSFRFGALSVSLDKNGMFDTAMVVSKPGYYTIESCSTYLVPGGNLDITYNSSTNDYSFTGTTANECVFLNKNPLNLYGDFSFIYGGKSVRNTFVETKQVVDSLASLRIKLLDSCKNLDPFFVEVEKARTKAHLVNSYLNYYMYTKDYVICDMGSEGQTPGGKEYIESVRGFIEPIVKEFFDERFAINSDIRWVVERCVNGGLITVPEGSIWDQLYTARGLMQKFENENGGLAKVVEEAKLQLPKFTDPELLSIIKNEIEQKDRLAPGITALEFELEDIDGNRVDVSAFKGRTIYIDLWATWCGICIAESPSFVKLKEEYPDVVFMSISIDEKKEHWKKFITAKPKTAVLQFIAVDNAALMNAWNVFGVPRCILIDKDYKIVDAYAPRPTTEEIKKLLDELEK
ncbi:MAG: TlpA family protein disulfide reductase [Bacteroidales bacterium]